MFLGLDIGTSSVKGVVTDDRGAVVAQAAAALTVSRPHPLWSEQDPEVWWSACEAAVAGIDPAVRRAVRGIGLAGQMHGATLLDAQDRPLRPAILWNDGRSYAECEALEALAPELMTTTGNRAMPGFTAPKLLWVRAHEPAIFERVTTVLLPKDYVRLRMTGRKASDVSDSAGTLWLDTARRAWSPAILAACGLSEAQMPQLAEGDEITGRLRPAVARRWGMEQVPIAGGGGDNAAGAAGVGVIKDGDALLSLGTSGVIFVSTREFRPNPAGGVHAFCHCLPDLWHQMSVHLSAAACVDWVARITGAADAADLFASAESVAADGGAELFLPYLSGERTPHNDPLVRGAFLNLDNDTDAPRLAQAVLEGVAFALRDGLDALTAAGTRIERLSVIGGGARSLYWGRIIASVLETPLVYASGAEVGPSLGAARLAQLAVDGGEPGDVCVAPHVSHVVEPHPDWTDRLSSKRESFRAAYPRITPNPGAS